MVDLLLPPPLIRIAKGKGVLLSQGDYRIRDKWPAECVWIGIRERRVHVGRD